MNDRTQLDTLAVHAGFKADPITGAVNPPVYFTSTYIQEEPGKHTGYEYARTQHPTREVLEKAVAELEGGTDGIAFASGCAATSTLIQLLKSGDHVVSFDDVYGGTRRIFEQIYTSLGIDFTFADLSNSDNFDAACTEKTRMLWIETPTNPMLKLADIRELSKRAKERGILVVVDNTFLSPYLQNPLSLGADIVLHSTTKYLNGHSDSVGGIVVTSNPELADRLRFLQNAIGAVPGPMDCYLVHRGLKTLALRMQRHTENAMQLASYLEAHPKVDTLWYPWLESHPQMALAREQTRGGGGMITMTLKGDLENARRFLCAVSIFALAESLGGVESLIEHPAIMTHASVPAKERAQLGISDTLVRLSVGVESVTDLRNDLDQALAAAY
ncbi:MAG: cystathionine gamma-synthase [Myxococcales bacterium]|nr:cystathionine gamma-synthase [Myxococcales bacterium]|tara:strand:- start:1702 stop:2859 length:1158 start_codon:yes stop_codon:yes gene_type:complete